MLYDELGLDAVVRWEDGNGLEKEGGEFIRCPKLEEESSWDGLRRPRVAEVSG